MSAVAVSVAVANPLQEFLSALIAKSQQQADFQHPVIKEILVRIAKTEMDGDGNFILNLTKSQKRVLATLIDQHHKNIWFDDDMADVSPLREKLLNDENNHSPLPPELQRAIIRETEFAFPAILDVLYGKYPQIMPEGCWMPAFKHSFSTARVASTTNWQEQGFYANGGISLALGGMVSWTGAVYPYFWEPKSYSQDRIIGSFTVHHWKHAVWAELGRCFCQLLCRRAYQVTGDPIYRFKSGTGFRDMYKTVRTDTVNQMLAKSGSLIGIKKLSNI